jgi:hypothetical protein
MDLKCDKPPMRAGKGENSWDCGPDGTFGIYRIYEGPKPNWKNRDQVFKWCVDKYVDGVFKDSERYGSTKHERGYSKEDEYTYLGRQKKKEIREGNTIRYEPIDGEYQGPHS